jgi:FeS assembly SUF system regulator
MIRIGKMTDYGIVLLSFFARGDEPQVFNARELAAQSQLPLPTVSKILKALSRGELLESQRGVSGGYRLARSADNISVAEIISVLEGPIAMTECSDVGHGNCDLETHCPIRGNWRKINIVVRKALEGLTLSDMTRPLPSRPVGSANYDRNLAMIAGNTP